MGTRILVAVGVAALLVGGVAHAGSDPVKTAATLPAPSAPAPTELPLVLSIRALSIGPAPFEAGSEMERVKAPTGAGSTRWPTGEIAKGVYISVMPACIPGVDEPLGPTRRTLPARRR
ncbi:MAG TPA: hypothetical protein VIB60_05395 [Methylomirabilota bacterium]|jgi:hypothetical protein